MDSALDRLLEFCFPSGRGSARSINGVRTVQRGEMRSSPTAQWTQFTAEEITEAARTSFRWEARIANKMGFLGVMDAYEGGKGRLTVKLGGIVPVKRLLGTDVDRGELQRYLGECVLCPAMLLNNSALQCADLGPSTIRLRDRNAPADWSVEVEIAEDGRPMEVRAERPRLVGNKSVLTGWSGVPTAFGERDGMRVATRMESRWHLPEGVFTAIHIEVESFELLR